LSSSQFTPKKLIDLGKDVFEEANVDTSIFILYNSERPHSNYQFQSVKINTMQGREFPPPITSWGQTRTTDGNNWRILSTIEWDIMDKMLKIGKPLNEWEETSLHRGILTGYDKAFLIDETTRNRLIEEDARSEEILRPILRGGDIQRYRAKNPHRWLISTHNGIGTIPPVDINQFPSVKKHLDQFHDEISMRYDRGNTIYNLRNCAYHGK